MQERRNIVALWDKGEAIAMVTLVRVEGSSYRRVGARLLLSANGEYAGSISGGCLEAEVMRKAAWMVRNGRAVIQQYSTLFDDTAEIPYGLGCGGTVHLLIEPAKSSACELLIAAMRRSLQGERVGIVTCLPEEGALSRSLVDSNEVRVPCGDLEAGCFTELLSPPQRLLVFGAGDDAQPLVRMASLLGWRSQVIDGRAQWARAERFPEAESVCVAGNIAQARIQAHPDDAVVIMTHSYEQDRNWLAELLPAAPRYLGLLGARHRSALLLAEVASLLEWDLSRVCGGLFAPIGLDLGGDGAEAIALATLAEIQARCEGKLGNSRRMTAELVLRQIERGDASPYLQAQCAL